MLSSLTSLLQLAPQAAAKAAAAAKGVKVPTPDALTHHGTFWMPEQANSFAHETDWMFYGILGLSAFCFFGITFAVVYFTWKYRARPGNMKAQPSILHNDGLEVTWTLIPSIIVVIIFVLGWRGYVNMATPPKNALEIKVIAQKWDWFFEYKVGPSASFTDTELHVPLDRPVRLTMTSKDVIHSFYVPAFRIKQDVVPARYTHLWFKAIRAGEYRLTCAEYCGEGHSTMKNKVVVEPPGGYELYLESKQEELDTMPPIELGKKTYQLCKPCHSTNGIRGNGPSFQGIWGTQVEMSDGSKVLVDENYIRESLMDPTAKIVKGFAPIMPTFKGTLRDKQIDGMIAFIKSLAK